jgi:hypothetical protein
MFCETKIVMSEKVKHLVLMADVISSHSKDANELMQTFSRIVKDANQFFKEKILSPLTITLGDEFQGVIDDIYTSVEIIIYLEEALIKEGAFFKLRYVLNQGNIDTPLNPERSYQMLGEGLTEARQQLGKMKSSNNRFNIALTHQRLTILLNDSFKVYQSIVDGWKPDKDYHLVSLFFKYHDYKIIAKLEKKERSLIWKREKTLNIRSYFAIRNVIHISAAL